MCEDGSLERGGEGDSTVEIDKLGRVPLQVCIRRFPNGTIANVSWIVNAGLGGRGCVGQQPQGKGG